MESRDLSHQFGNPYEAVIQLLRQIQIEHFRVGRHLRYVDQFLAGESAFEMGQIPSGAISTKHQKQTLAIYCLGSFNVRVDGEEISHWKCKKAKTLLEYLIDRQRRPVSKDILMEMLWPECEPRMAGNNLKATVRSLRQALDLPNTADKNPEWILFQDGHYLVNPGVDAWTDVEEFMDHWTRGWQHERDGQVDAAIRAYYQAEVLYRGDYLEEDLYIEWTHYRREALKDVYLTILGKLSDYHIEHDEFYQAIDYCQKIIDKDHCREDAYRRLMISHSRLGNRNRALEWYKICENTVNMELGLPPDPQTQELCNGLKMASPV
jgi:LuxR family maltose regulon positive regulatory protein